MDLKLQLLKNKFSYQQLNSLNHKVKGFKENWIITISLGDTVLKTFCKLVKKKTLLYD